MLGETWIVGNLLSMEWFRFTCSIVYGLTNELPFNRRGHISVKRTSTLFPSAFRIFGENFASDQSTLVGKTYPILVRFVLRNVMVCQSFCKVPPLNKGTDEIFLAQGCLCL